MEYNSQKEDIIIPEYGRNVQQLVGEAMKLDDPEKRQAFAERIVHLMSLLNPNAKGLEDYQEKLWNHLFRISEFKLDVTAPEHITIKPEDSYVRPDPLDYPATKKEFRHYGHYVQKMVDKAKEMEPGEKRDAFVSLIGSYMKMAYRTWNREHFVSDELIMDDLKNLSGGVLELTEGGSLDLLASATSGNNRGRRIPANTERSGNTRRSKRSGGRNRRTNNSRRNRRRR